MPKYKGPTSMISEAMEAHYKEKQEGRYARDRGIFWPSSASIRFTNKHGEVEVAGKCIRQEYWDIKQRKVTNKTNARSIRIWEYGKNIEAVEIKAAKIAGLHVEDGTPFTHEFGNGLSVRGRLDAIYEVNSIKFGLEYKSGYGNHFKRNLLGLGWDGKRMRSDPGEPRISNVLQTLLYLDHFRGELDVFFISYIDRGDGSNRDYKIEIDKKGHPVIDGKTDRRYTVHDIYERFEELQEYSDRDEVPPPDFDPYYSDERVEELRDRGDLTKRAYDLHHRWKDGKSGGRRAGYFMCNGYCPYEAACKRKILQDEKNARSNT
jgi:hypothetical protein